MTRFSRGGAFHLAALTATVLLSVPGVALAADSLSSVSEPGSLFLLGSSLFVLATALRRRRRARLARQIVMPRQVRAEAA